MFFHSHVKERFGSNLAPLDMAALESNGRLYTWGCYRDANGVLGFKQGRTEHQPTPELFEGLRVAQVASGDHSTIALSTKGEISIWGDHRIGQRFSSRVRNHSRDQALVPTPILLKRHDFDLIAAGGFHFFARSKTDRQLYAWGLNNFGQLGLGLLDDGEEADPKYEETIFAPQPVPKPVKLPFDAYQVKQIAAGQHHSLLLTHDGRVFAFGRTNYGQLGLGDNVKNNRHRVDTPTPIPTFDAFPADDRVVHIASGGHHCVAVTAKGRAFAWGFGDTGALCQGPDEEEDCSSPSPVPLNKGMAASGSIVYATGGGQHTLLVLPRPADDPTATPQKA